MLTVGLVLGMGAWAVQAFAWPALDSSASSTFTPWVFAVADMMFAVGAAMMLLRLEHRRAGSAPVEAPATSAADDPVVPQTVRRYSSVTAAVPGARGVGSRS